MSFQRNRRKNKLPAAAHHPAHRHLIHHFHHIFHLVELFNESIDFINVFAAAFRYPFFPALIYKVRVSPLEYGHGVYYRLYALE